MVKLSVAGLLERELERTIEEWLKLVNIAPGLTAIVLSDADHTSHLPKTYHDLITRLRLGTPSSISVAAIAHGRVRRAQGYSVAMLIEESRACEVATFGTLHLHQNELDEDQVILDVGVIADEVDSQLTQAVSSMTKGSTAAIA